MVKNTLNQLFLYKDSVLSKTMQWPHSCWMCSSEYFNKRSAGKWGMENGAVKRCCFEVVVSEVAFRRSVAVCGL